MNLRSTIAVAVVALCALTAATGCSASSPSPTSPAPTRAPAAAKAKPSPTGTPVSVTLYLNSLHDYAAQHPTRFPRFLRGATPDPVLLAAGLKACDGLLEGHGWSHLDANQIGVTAEWAGLCQTPGLTATGPSGGA
ncbi:hypothetical protein [Streptacidiphilus jiangxiensis]|uniref:Uncharacterized protein n=1 Tax=Streptacidiphilus jiangxiensis TaxID=235985 RepID=A0A1H7UKX0_STRJI|nr:hypothetical protein [Streptacidiphilus jiangxiensis]SEL97394.1 hypothetical protein SAMN05414137_11614 [Streptacidiphilus jiangxiensis]